MRGPLFVAGALLGSLLHAAAAQEAIVRLKVEAGDLPRYASPVSCTLQVGSQISAESATELLRLPGVTLRQRQGSAIPCEVDVAAKKDGAVAAIIVSWIDPPLEKGASRTCELLARAPGVPAYRFAEGEGYRDLLLGDRPIYRYMTAYDPARHADTFKPFHHVFGLNGEGLVTKGTGGLYPHHRGLFFGFNKTKYGDFWHGKAGQRNVTQLHRGYLPARESTGPVLARAASTTEWCEAGGKAVFRDIREVTAWNTGPRATLLDYEISVESLDGNLKLDGDAQHAGFHFRAAQEVADSKGAKYIRPSTAVDRKNDVWAECPWIAMQFSVQGHPYTLIHMDGAGNPRPTVYSTRNYGRTGAFFTSELVEGRPLVLHYRILLLDGTDVSQQAAELWYRDYLAPRTVTVVRD